MSAVDKPGLQADLLVALQATRRTLVQRVAGIVQALDDNIATGGGGGGTPAAHASSHASGGSDPVTLAQSQVTGLTGALSGLTSNIASLTADVSTLTSGLTAKEDAANKGAANGYASLDSSSKVVQDPANATATPTASKIPIASGAGTLATGWIPALPQSQITDLETDLAAKEDAANKGAPSGYASLDGSSKVVQDPANATATPTAGKIPIADGSGKLDSGWIPTVSTSLRITVAVNVTVSDSPWVVVGSVRLNGTTYASGVTFVAEGYVTNSGWTVEVVLYNLTDASTVDTRTLSSTTTSASTSGTLALPAGSKQYEIRLRRQGSGANPGYAVLTHAEIVTI